MTTTTTALQQENLDRREAILQAALTLFSQRGFYGTAVPDIAQLAHVGTGTIYRYFANKEALVNALYQRYKPALSAAFFHGIDPTAAPRAIFRHFWRSGCAFAREHPTVMSFLELHHHAPYLDPTSRALEGELMSVGVAFIQTASANLVLKDADPMMLLYLVWGAFRGLVQGAEQERLRLDEVTISGAEECCWAAIRR